MELRDFKTVVLEDSIISYTCQSPNENQLKKNLIQKIGTLFGIGNGEVLKIPKKAFEKKGVKVSNDPNVAQIQTEALLRDLS